jgi:hypothetical protein
VRSSARTVAITSRGWWVWRRWATWINISVLYASNKCD